MFAARLDNMLESLKKEELQLIAENRKDEAAMIRIRANIAGIGKTVWQVVERTEKAEDRKRVYCAKMDALRAAWEESRTRAEKYADQDKVVIEELKLDQLEKVLDAFEECVA